MKISLHNTGESIRLSSLIKKHGISLDVRCGDNGTCGRCRVLLCSGEFEADGKLVKDFPCEVLSCHTKMLSEFGEIEIPESSLVAKKGQVSSSWHGEDLLKTSETVVAIDIGTTTIAAIKICNGEIKKQASCYNSQSNFGDNVITRINYATTPTGIKELQQAVVNSINELLAELDITDISRIGVAGNTVMSCLLHGIDPTPIGVMPFDPPTKVFPIVKASDLGINSGVELLTVPAIAGYVGGDLTAGYLETNLQTGEMLIDIGTNCEIIFSTEQGVFCTAAAAGPAFEGASIECGCRATNGAIDHYFGQNNYSVIGGGIPKGLCGSAMIDFLAVEHELGHLNGFGRLIPHAEFFEIATNLRIYESDIEQLLKAKAAVIAGIVTLENHCGTTAKKIYLAGGFAQFLNLENTKKINMLPAREYKIVGNTSLAGAARLACDPELMDEFENLINIPHDVALNTLAEFEDNYIDGLMLE